MKEKLHTYFAYSLCAIACMIPLFPNALPLLIILSLALWLIAVPTQVKLENLKKNIIYFFAFSGLFWTYLLSMLYTANQSEGWMKIETSLSLILFPLLFFTSFDKKTTIPERAIRWFVYGCIAATVTCYLYSLFYYLFPEVVIANKWSDYDYKLYFFWKERLSPFLHTTYLSMYLNTAILFLTFRAVHPSISKTGRLLLISLFSITILLLSSRAGLITLALLWAILIFRMLVYEKQFLPAGLIIALIIAVFSGLFFLSEQFHLRVSSMFGVFTGTDKENTAIQKSLIRLKIWPAAYETGIKQLPWGAGIGDANDKLQETYVENGMIQDMERMLNAHNQFLQTFIAAGIPGLLALLLLLLLPVYHSVKNKDWLALTFISILTINFLFESMFQTQAGIVFFAFINTALFSPYLKK